MIGVAVQQPPWLVVMEYLEYGDLKGVLETCAEKNFKLELREQLSFIQQLASGLAFMHNIVKGVT